MTLNEILLAVPASALDASALILRIFIGICFVIHGLGKLGVVGTGNLTGFEAWLKSLGIPFASLQARLAAGGEILGGALMTLGFFSRAGALLCLAIILVAAVIGHKGGGYLITNNPPGNEYTLNLAAVLTVMIWIGPGMYSLDALLF